METLEIRSDQRIEVKLLRKCIWFEFCQGMRRTRFWLYLVLAGVISILSWLLNHQLLLHLSVLMIIIIGAWVVYQSMKYLRVYLHLLHSSRSSALPDGTKYTFQYDEEGMRFLSGSEESFTKWDELDQYAVHKGDLYVYVNQHIFNIFSPSIMGQEAFDRFRNLAQRKLTKRA